MRYIILFLSILLSSVAISQPIKDVDIYSLCDAKVNTNYPYDIKVHYVNCRTTIANNLTAQIRDLRSIQAIKSLVKDYMESHKDHLKQAFNEESQQVKNKLQRYPAVVINHQYAIYGTDDFETAKSKYYEHVG